VRHDTHTPGRAPAPLTQALADLAHLSLEAGDPSEDLQTLADALLAYIRHCCGAPLGALLVAGSVTAADATRVVCLPDRSDTRFFALATFGVADPRTLASKPAALEPHMDTATLMAGDIWVTQPVPLASGALSLSVAGPSPVTVAPVTQAIVLLGWPVASTPPALLDEARESLRFLADGIGATLSHLLLRQQVTAADVGSGGSSNPLHPPAVPPERASRVANRLTDELLETLSHELRTPLAAIRGYTATLLRYADRIVAEDRHRFLTAIEATSERLSITVERILELSQLEAGTVVMRQEPVAITSVAHEAIAAAEWYACRRTPPVTLRLRSLLPAATPEHPGPLVRGDARRLRTVLDQLLENAVKFSPAGGEIDISLQAAMPAPRHKRGANGARAGSGAPRLEITVRDHGIGIPSDQLWRIFEGFHRVDTRSMRAVEGLGIGLTLCKHIVEQHHGELWAESQEGNGSSFHLTLPMIG
jgi:signal transduction histidine kinase